MGDLNALIFNAGVVPTLFAEDVACAERVINAIEKTDIPVVEILQRGDMALDAFKEAVKRKKTAHVGAGTVCTLDHCKQMVDLGADFIVSPGYNAEIVDWCVKHSIPVIPGVSNPTEVMLAANAGLKLAKFFPFYELGGEKYLNGIAGPFPDMKFVISGCLDDHELHYLSNHRIAGITAVCFFQTETDHTVFSEDEIVRRLNRCIEIGKHYRNGW